MNLSHRQRFIDGFGHFSLGVLSAKIQLFISACKMASSTSCVKSKMLWFFPNIFDHISMEAFGFVYLLFKTDLPGKIHDKPLESKTLFYQSLLDSRCFDFLQTPKKIISKIKNIRFYHFCWFYYTSQTHGYL